MKLWLDDQFAAAWQVSDPFAAVAAINGKIYRQKEGRTTLSFDLAGRSYFLKLHRGIGWGEIFKNLIQGRAPVLGAANEFEAARKLTALGVDTLTPVAFGERGLNPAARYSFLITEDLAGTTDLEALCARWRDTPPAWDVKQALLARVAKVSRLMHDNGINHRDYYLCHFLLDPASITAPVSEPDLRCYLIDLHRAQQRTQTPLRWRIKDLAALYFSAMDIGLTRRDVLRFISIYSGRSWRDCLASDAGLWQAVAARAAAMYRRDHATAAPALFPSEAQQ